MAPNANKNADLRHRFPASRAALERADFKWAPSAVGGKAAEVTLRITFTRLLKAGWLQRV